MTRPIGYYVHHHGDGHRQRAIQIASRAPDRFVLLGTGLEARSGGLRCVDLADDRPDGRQAFDGADGTDDRPQALHYAPIDHEGVRSRAAGIAGWIASARPALMVVDVSVEVAMLARLTSTPTVYVRLTGRRDDPAHLDAFRGATALMCPFSAPLDDPGTPDWIRGKTHYAAGLTPEVARREVREDVVLVVVGRGGAVGEGARIAETARAYPEFQWRVAGPVSPVSRPPANLILLGWTEAASDEIARAGVVVGGAGNGLVNAVLAADRPFICLPEPRPYDEQFMTGRRLEALGAAVVVEGGWPPARAWSALLAEARGLDPVARAGLVDAEGPAATARWLFGLADGACATAVPSVSNPVLRTSA